MNKAISPLTLEDLLKMHNDHKHPLKVIRVSDKGVFYAKIVYTHQPEYHESLLAMTEQVTYCWNNKRFLN